MPKINLLPKNLVELIAAGEVVERPASVIKELVENAIDAGSHNITVEIQNGGILYMRVADNGCGISSEDIRAAFVSHATSKISKENDLYEIGTLGFRGEALASIAAVSKVEVFTRTPDSNLGTHYSIEGGNETVFEEVGCPKGTTFIIRDIFFNTPARMKFLKKDVTESNLISALLDRMAMSHPEVAFKFIRDGKQIISTSGDGKLSSAIYAVRGREFFSNVIPIVSNLSNGVKVEGYIGLPTYGKGTRNGQFCYLNGRLVKSATVCAALEQAYKNSIMVGKFPVCVLNVKIPFGMVDVNVHPAKTEVRFSDEKLIFDSVYYAVKSTLTAQNERPSMELPGNKETFSKMNADEFKSAWKNDFSAKNTFGGKTILRQPPVFSKDRAVQSSIDIDIAVVEPKTAEPAKLPDYDKAYFEKKDSVDNSQITDNLPDIEYKKPKEEYKEINVPTAKGIKPIENIKSETVSIVEDDVIIVGEAFKTYVLAQKGESLFVIDKHAAHERMIYDRIKTELVAEKQMLIEPQTISLNKEDYNSLVEQIDVLDSIGFEVEDFSDGVLMVRTVPASLCGEDVSEMLSEIAASLQKGGGGQPAKVERMYCTVACRAAIKAGDKSSKDELLKLAKAVLSPDGVMCCPHGRPVAFEIKRRDFEKQFGRLQ